MLKLNFYSACFITVFVWILFSSTVSASESASTTATSSNATSTIVNPIQVEAKVREYFVDIPVMIEIARCESGFRQFTDSGSVFRGGVGGVMVGVFQFYESLHTSSALALGFDLTTLDGNLGYARHLYLTSGTQPWASCVPVTTNPANVDTNKELKIKLLKQIIALLEELLKLKLAE